MKKATVLLLAIVGMSYLAVAQPSEGDQRWLTAVQKMVVNGQTSVSTPSQDRVTIFKEWAVKQGYSVQVVKTESGYRLEVVRHLASN